MIIKGYNPVISTGFFLKLQNYDSFSIHLHGFVQKLLWHVPGSLHQSKNISRAIASPSASIKNAAVGLIQRKAFNTQLVGHRFGGCAVKYALHVTGNGNIEVFIQWLIGLNELIKLSVKNKTIQLNQPNLT